METLAELCTQGGHIEIQNLPGLQVETLAELCTQGGHIEIQN